MSKSRYSSSTRTFNKYNMRGSGKLGEKNGIHIDLYEREPYDGNFFGRKNKKKRKQEECYERNLLKKQRMFESKNPLSCGYDPNFLSEDLSKYESSSSEEEYEFSSSSDEED